MRVIRRRGSRGGLPHLEAGACCPEVFKVAVRQVILTVVVLHDVKGSVPAHGPYLGDAQALHLGVNRILLETPCTLTSSSPSMVQKSVFSPGVSWTKSELLCGADKSGSAARNF